jgi:hypothetical protein
MIDNQKAHISGEKKVDFLPHTVSIDKIDQYLLLYPVG